MKFHALVTSGRRPESIEFLEGEQTAIAQYARLNCSARAARAVSAGAWTSGWPYVGSAGRMSSCDSSATQPCTNAGRGTCLRR